MDYCVPSDIRGWCVILVKFVTLVIKRLVFGVSFVSDRLFHHVVATSSVLASFEVSFLVLFLAKPDFMSFLVILKYCRLR